VKNKKYKMNQMKNNQPELRGKKNIQVKLKKNISLSLPVRFFKLISKKCKPLKVSRFYKLETMKEKKRKTIS